MTLHGEHLLLSYESEEGQDLVVWTLSPHYLRAHFYSTNHHMYDLRKLHNPSVPQFPQVQNEKFLCHGNYHEDSTH